ncbi:MAG: hypothetical protein DWQ05_15325 [Calditrichaeota bacterium]|nr:MAG: hypothetical protein DWQ05_15325 [Calditrichota bacterium]
MSENSTFLGTGWSFPPAFTQAGADVKMSADAEDIHQSLQILFSTSLGERIMREDYGCDLQNLLFEEIDQGLVNQISRLITDGILYHEPRIELEKIEVSESKKESGLLLISLEYTIRSTNSRFNMVYPFYVNEANTE